MNSGIRIFFLSAVLHSSAVSCTDKPFKNEKEKEEAWNKYSSIVAQADKHFLNENWSDAKKSYSSASRLVPEEIYPKDKLQECEFMIKIVKKGANEKICDEMINVADNLFDTKRYYRAKEMYRRVLDNCNSDSSYIDNQLLRIKDSLHIY